MVVLFAPSSDLVDFFLGEVAFLSAAFSTGLEVVRDFATALALLGAVAFLEEARLGAVVFFEVARLAPVVAVFFMVEKKKGSFEQRPF